MLYDLDRFRRRLRRDYTVDDLTMVVAVRAHDHNPWVKERLRILGGYYEPAPRCIIVDFGSEEPHRAEVRSIAEGSGLDYLYVGDDGVFSLAKARNLGAAHARTDLLFFSDIDCFGSRDLCGRLIAHANAIDIAAVFDQIIKLPVYHLTRKVTVDFLEADAEQRSALLESAFAESVHSPPGTAADFVDPSSNFFVCRRDFYDMVGGYNEAFRGHGSEDYEFLLRLAVYSGQFPLPQDPAADDFGPLGGSFFGPKYYRGFRRLGELFSFQAEMAGLRIAHLHHPRPAAVDGWYASSDWKRTRFADQVGPFLTDRMQLLRYDWMPRTRSALVLICHDWHYEFFVPLRLAGYRLVLCAATDRAACESAHNMIVNRKVDAVAVFNPYMRSHSMLLPLFEQARASGLPTIVVERGTLPESWYYAEDVSYVDADWSAATLQAYIPTHDERALADDYIGSLRSGGHTLEESGSMERTMSRYSSYRHRHSKICFVPLQIDDDLAVTRFTEGHISYPTFRTSLAQAAEKHPDVLFLIKPHPLSTNASTPKLANVVTCAGDDNVHALIELADAIICYNSGVGLLALIHRKYVVTVGNAFYNLPEFGRRAATVDEAVEIAFSRDAPRGSGDMAHYVAWLLFRKYSFFKADSHYRHLGHRRSHEYRDIRFYHFNFETRQSMLRARFSRPFSKRSYSSGRLGVDVAKRARGPVALLGRGPNGHLAGLRRKLSKLQRSPKEFFADSRIPALRWIGRAILANRRHA